jgi:hypothetical protein
VRSKSKILKSPGLLSLDSALQWNDGVTSRCEFKELRSGVGADDADLPVFSTSEKNANEDTRHRAASAETDQGLLARKIHRGLAGMVHLADLV